jgi:ABC-type multidrug transport system ATPase subunit
MLGYLPQDFGLYPTLTARQMLDYLAKLKGHLKQTRTPRFDRSLARES